MAYQLWREIYEETPFGIKTSRRTAEMEIKMGTFGGHIGHGLAMMAIGVWHILNTARNYARSHSHFDTRPWFTVNARSLSKHLELYTIMLFTAISITTELFVSPARHRPWDPDGSIPLSHMNRVEHATISLSFFVYALVALAVDKYQVPTPEGLMHALAAVGFAEELLLFHFHSTEAVGVEEHYHWLLQVVIGVNLGSTLAEAGCPHRPLVALVRSASVAMQGLWLIHMAFALWIPSSIPRGCALHKSKDVFVAKCSSPEATARAIGMANLHFTWDLLLVLLLTLGMLFWYTNTNNTAKRIAAYRPVDLKEYDMPTLDRYCGSRSSPSDHDIPPNIGLMNLPHSTIPVAQTLQYNDTSG